MIVPDQQTPSSEEVICHMHNLKLHETYGFTYHELIAMDIDKYYELIKRIVDLKTIGFKTTVRLDRGLKDLMKTVHQPQTTEVTDAIPDLSFFTKPASGCEKHQTIGRLHTNADEKDLKGLVGKDDDVVTVTSLKSGIRAPVGSFYKFLHAPQAPLFMSQSMLPSDTTDVIEFDAMMKDPYYFDRNANTFNPVTIGRDGQLIATRFATAGFFATVCSDFAERVLRTPISTDSDNAVSFFQYLDYLFGSVTTDSSLIVSEISECCRLDNSVNLTKVIKRLGDLAYKDIITYPKLMADLYQAYQSSYDMTIRRYCLNRKELEKIVCETASSFVIGRGPFDTNDWSTTLNYLVMSAQDPQFVKIATLVNEHLRKDEFDYSLDFMKTIHLRLKDKLNVSSLSTAFYESLKGRIYTALFAKAS